MQTKTASGKPLDDITLEAVLSGQLTPQDLRIHPDALRHQADVAQQHGSPQLALNLRRAAELVVLSDEEVLAIYESLRPHRSTKSELEAIAGRLHENGAALCASLVREAAVVYNVRGLLHQSR
jgi:propanediol dehydratase small subunit